MNFVDYQVATRKTAVYPEAEEGTIGAISYVALGLGEAGEVQGKVKKALRDHGGLVTPTLKDAIQAELGDVLWYVARLADELGLSLEDVVSLNLEKLNSRRERGVLQGSGDYR
jgi:NTP pyrophosphatase (non-canonical NTP hydrolase)